MKFKHDPQADATYIYLSEKPYAYGKDLDDERRIDYASDSVPIGVELLCVSKGVNIHGLPCADEIADLLEDNGIKTYAMYIMEGYPVPGVPGGVVFNVNLASPGTVETEKPTARIKREKEEVTV